MMMILIMMLKMMVMIIAKINMMMTVMIKVPPLYNYAEFHYCHTM